MVWILRNISFWPSGIAIEISVQDIFADSIFSVQNQFITFTENAVTGDRAARCGCATCVGRGVPSAECRDPAPSDPPAAAPRPATARLARHRGRSGAAERPAGKLSVSVVATNWWKVNCEW